MSIIPSPGLLTTASGPYIYGKTELDRELRQAEILSDVKQHLVTLGDDGFEVTTIIVPYAIVFTQDCDLLQEFDKREAGGSSDLSAIMLFEAMDANIARSGVKGSDIWKRMRQNKDERFQAFEEVKAEQDKLGKGLPALMVDFKRYFSVNPVSLYEQIESLNVKRRTRLEMPYREHFQVRAAFFMQRVMLPRQHVVA